MPKANKERQAASQRHAGTKVQRKPAGKQSGKSNTEAAVRQSITFNKDFGQHILKV